MGPRVPFVSNRFGAVSPNKVVYKQKIGENGAILFCPGKNIATAGEK